MFGNRHYAWKLGGSLALIGLLGAYAGARSDRLNPPLWRCVAQPSRWDGALLWIPRARLLRRGPADFEIAAGDPEVRIRVDGPATGGPGDFISLRATFHAAGPSLSAERIRTVPPHSRLRWLMEVVSVAVVLGVLANFARHFRFRPDLLGFGKGR